MRYVRESRPEYSRIPLNELYCNTLSDNATVAASCPVDGRSILNEIPYTSNAGVTLEPNSVYNPQSAENPGWDRLLIMEAFPLASKSKKNSSYLFLFKTNSVQMLQKPLFLYLISQNHISTA
jgi:hypothetical protein